MRVKKTHAENIIMSSRASAARRGWRLRRRRATRFFGINSSGAKSVRVANDSSIKKNRRVNENKKPETANGI